MGAASQIRCLYMFPCCSQFSELPAGRDRSRFSNSIFPSRSSNIDVGLKLLRPKRKFSRPASSNLQSKHVAAPAKACKVKTSQNWPMWIAVLAGTSLLDSSARAETLADACVEIAGGNLDNIIVFACIVQAIALTGAAVGGVIARQRKHELEKINGQLRQINLNLRRQSRVESYAPSLTYAPVGGSRSGVLEMPARTEPVRDELIQRLKGGKQLLREKTPAQAFAEFEKAMALARRLKDHVEEKKAARGLGASCQRQGKYKEAIKYHMQVLTTSGKTGEQSGNTEAYGAIADCYTELGDLESAAKFYDQYIERLENEEVD